MQRLTIYKQFGFEASHVLPKHEGKCARLHGHSWRLTVGVSGPVVEETGFVVDYGKLSEMVNKGLIQFVDHHHLGQGSQQEPNQWHKPTFGEDFYPSSENLVMCFVRLLKPLITELGGGDKIITTKAKVGVAKSVIPCSLQLEEVGLEETCTCAAVWRRRDGNRT